MNGFLIHPWDLLDEGAISVYDVLHELGFSTVYVGINSIAEKHPPFPVKAKLTHNTRRSAHISEKGTYYFKFSPEKYNKMNIPLQKTIAPYITDRDVLEEALKYKKDFSMNVYAWVRLFTNDYLAENCPEYAVSNILGERNEQWICFENPIIKDFLIELIKDICTRYAIDGILLDCTQYVYPYINLLWLHRGFSCFCEHCQIKMREFGINEEVLRLELMELSMKSKTFTKEQLVKLTQTTDVDIKSFFYSKKEIYRWMYFKFTSLAKFIGEIHTIIKANSQELGVALSSPRSSWMVGQSYKMISNVCDWIMPMLYRRIWGYHALRSIDELKKSVVNTTLREKAGKIYKYLADAYFAFNGFLGPLKEYEMRKGIEQSVITSENDEVIRALKNEKSKDQRGNISQRIRYFLENPDQISERFREFTFPAPKTVPIYPSIELWDPISKDPTPKRSVASLDALLKSNHDGIIFQSYGWAPMQNIYAVSDYLKKGGSND